MIDNQDSSVWSDMGYGAAVEGGTTLAEQGGLFLGGAGIAYGVSKIGGRFSPTLGTKSGVISRGLVGGFKALNGDWKRALLNYGGHIGLSAVVGGIGLHMMKSNVPINKINSNEAVDPTLTAAAGGAMAGAAFVGIPVAVGMKVAGSEMAEIMGSKSISNYLDKRANEILGSKTLSDIQRQEAINQIIRYKSMQDRVNQNHSRIQELESIKKKDRTKEQQAELKQLKAERSASAIDIAKEVRRGILGDKISGVLEKSTDKLSSKLYHMRGRSAAIIGGSMLLGAAVGAGYRASQQGGS